MRGSSSTSVVVRLASVVAAFSLVLAMPLSASAMLEDEAKYQSSTHPGVGTDVTWRWQWGNTLTPDLKVTSVPTDGSDADRHQTDGFIYEIRQLDTNGLGAIVPQWGISSLSARAEGTTIKDTFDLASLIKNTGWVPRAGASVFGEGVYGLTLRYYNQFRVEDPATTDRIVFGVDFTPPNPVEELTSTGGVYDATGQYSETRRRDLRWKSKGYDALSGVGGFKILVDGNVVEFAHNSAPDPLFEPYAAFERLISGEPYFDDRPQLSNVTVEDLPAGKSTVSVVVVDRATNESTAKSITAYVDYDTPEIDITNPTVAGQRIPVAPTFTVNTTDAAGLAAVKYYVDGVLVGSSTTAPYSFTANLSNFANGTHTLKAVAEDNLAGVAGLTKPHSASDSIDFVLDKTAPTATYISGAPNPFFPRKRDGYKDNFKVKFRSSEAGTARLKLYNSSGKLVRTVTKSIPAGATSISWTGKRSTGSVIAGTYKWRLSLTDAAGNTRTSSARRVTIKFYEIVRVSSSSVRIIAR